MSDTTNPRFDWDAENAGFQGESGVGIVVRYPDSEDSASLCWDETIQLHAWLSKLINTRPLAQAPLSDLPRQLRIDADDLSGCGAGNEAEHARQAAAEIEDLRISVVAFGAPAMAEYARDRCLPPKHLHPAHYDILKRAGARMDSFIRGTES